MWGMDGEIEAGELQDRNQNVGLPSREELLINAENMGVG